MEHSMTFCNGTDLKLSLEEKKFRMRNVTDEDETHAVAIHLSNHSTEFFLKFP